MLANVYIFYSVICMFSMLFENRPISQLDYKIISDFTSIIFKYSSVCVNVAMSVTCLSWCFENNPHYIIVHYFKGWSQRPFSNRIWLNINNAVLHTYFMRGAFRLNVIARILVDIHKSIYIIIRYFSKHLQFIFCIVIFYYFFFRNSLSEYFENKCSLTYYMLAIDLNFFKFGVDACLMLANVLLI